MKVLVIGGGGREHALAWKLAQSPRVQTVFVAPGNGGTAQYAGKPISGGADIQNVHAHTVEAWLSFAKAQGIALTVVGPEGPLAAGVVDAFRAVGLRIFGPTQAAAQLESSKAFSKAFMQRHGIPTARHETFTDAQAARAYVTAQGAPIVVKADGLAAGKGVVVAQTVAEAHAAIDDMLGSNTLGVQHNGQARVVVEEFLAGEEASFIVVCDGQTVVPLATSQDHKRLLDGDLGPNTGGMGAYSPAPVVTPQVFHRAMHDIIWPTVRGMAADGVPFGGFLYAGLMIDANGQPKTLEFNTRMGDPETQPIMMRLKSDLFEVLYAAADGQLAAYLGDRELEWDRRVALGVVVAAAGYPQHPRKGDNITALPTDTDECVTFHAGTNQQVTVPGATSLHTSGGRVLCVTALGANVKAAQQAAYAAVEQVRFEGAQFRKDIGHRAVK